MIHTKRITILYTDSGGGHRATARALQSVLSQQGGYEVTLCNPYRELMADLDLFPRFSRYTNEDVYNHFVLGKNWSGLFCLLFYALTMLNIRLGKRRSIKRLVRHWQEESRPDLVISVMPLANQSILQAIRQYTQMRPVPFLVLITDYMESMRYSWFPKGQDYHILCCSETAYRKALRKPHPPAQTFSINGLPVNPAFYEPFTGDRAQARKDLGLDPQRLTGCMMYGGTGSRRMFQLAKALRHLRRDFQMIFLCGHNHDLARELEQLHLPYPHIIRTYTTEIPLYFALSDFLVCKPGPGTISEASVAGISVLVDRKHLLPQERPNLRWIRECGLGQAFRSTKVLLQAIAAMADTPAPNKVEQPAQARPQAVLEALEVVNKVLG
ncbi:MAG: hypothetical protein JW739_05320 [Opitutales bacterium]|nr:hypothetical protein [Opitutales bacterium]